MIILDREFENKWIPKVGDVLVVTEISGGNGRWRWKVKRQDSQMTQDREPTEEHIKKLWEWCGFKAIKHKDCYARQTEHGKSHLEEICCYTFPDGTRGHAFLPDLDLNNLFKYAVPKLIDKYGGLLFVLPQSDISSWECKILNKPNDTATFGFDEKDPALALFLAIWELIKDG